MSRSRKPITKKPQDELSREHARLTREISELEDALVLHQRLLDNDFNGVVGSSRQDEGDYRWKYGGEGKLLNFRSKADLNQLQKAEGHRSRGNAKPKPFTSTASKNLNENTSQEADPADPQGPQCLNEDAALKKKAVAIVPLGRKRSSKSSAKSVHQKESCWSFGPGKMKVNGKEYDAVMHDLFGEGGCPFEKDYSIQSAAVGVSLFAEKDNTDLNEMKSKVLKRASAVLIMRPRSATATHLRYPSRQKDIPGTKNQNVNRNKLQKKIPSMQVRRKGQVKDVHSEAGIRLDVLGRTRQKKPVSESSETRKFPLRHTVSANSQLTGKDSEDSVSIENSSLVEGHTPRPQKIPSHDDKHADEILELFDQHKDTEMKTTREKLVIGPRYSLSNRVWDKDAVPKPWDKWRNLKALDISDSTAADSSKQSVEQVANTTSKSLYSAPNNFRRSGRKLSMVRSWNASQRSPGVKKQDHSGHESVQRHSWTGEFCSDIEKLYKPKREPKSATMADNLPACKQKVVTDWLDKHVNGSLEDKSKYAPSHSSGSFFEAYQGRGIRSAHNLADITAQAAGVESCENTRKVAAWLTSLGLKNVENYEKIFSQHQVDLVDVPSLTIPVLQQMGITKIGPTMKIMRGVDRLNVAISKATKKMRKVHDFDSEESLCASHDKSGELHNQEPLKGDSAARSSAENTRKGSKDSSRNDRRQSYDANIHRKKKVTKTEPARGLPPGLQELFRQCSGEQLRNQSGGEDALNDASRETSPFDLFEVQPENDLSHSSADTLQIVSELDASQKHIGSAMSQAKKAGRLGYITSTTANKNWSKSGKVPLEDPGKPKERVVHGRHHPRGIDSLIEADREASRILGVMPSSGVTKATGKVKERSPSNKFRGQGDAPQFKTTSSKIDAGIAQLTQKLADWQKEREIEEDLLEKRLQKLRQQRNAMATRHGLRERSRSADRECMSLPLAQFEDSSSRRGRRKSDSGLERTTVYESDSAEEVLNKTLSSNPVFPANLASEKQEKAALLQSKNGKLKLSPEEMKLKEVRKLQNKLQQLEQSLLHVDSQTTPAKTPAKTISHAAEPGHDFTQASSGELGVKDFQSDLEAVHPEGRDQHVYRGTSGVSCGYPRPFAKIHQESSSPHIPLSQTCISPSQDRFKKLPKSLKKDQKRKTGFDADRTSIADYNRNALVVSPPLSIKSEKISVSPVINLGLPEVMLELESSEHQNVPLKGHKDNAPAPVKLSAVPHMSMSKRQLLDEIRREKDEHRRNVRHLKSELARLQHIDPVKTSEVEYTDLEFMESDLVGEGAFSKVFRGKYQGAEVAVKRLKTPLSSQDKNYFAAEVSLLRDLRHPCVVLLVGVSTADRLPVMVLEFMAGRDLYTLIHDSSRPALDHAEYFQIARDVSSGMVYLHNHRPPVLHLDLKSMNVLLTSTHRAKIADFGFSKLKHDADKKARKPAKLKKVEGSPAWMAPELIQGGEITSKADVFSFGIILWEMLSRNHPYKGCSVFQILELVRTNRRPEIPELCPHDLSSLIVKCWDQKPAVRPNFKEVLKQLEEMSFPPSWRTLFKAAAVPAEALEDLTTTRQIISLVSSTLESTALRMQNQVTDVQNQGGEETRNEKKNTAAGKEMLAAINSSGSCYYSFSDEETPHLEDSLDTAQHRDSLEIVSSDTDSVADVSFADSLESGSKTAGNFLKLSQNCSNEDTDIPQHLHLSYTHETSVQMPIPMSGVPSLLLDNLRSPSPPAVHHSLSSVYESAEEECTKSIPHAYSGQASEATMKTDSSIVPRLSLGDIDSEDAKALSPRQEQQAVVVSSVHELNPLSSSMEMDLKQTADVSLKEKNKEMNGCSNSIRSLSARQARRLGLSRQFTASTEQFVTSCEQPEIYSSCHDNMEFDLEVRPNGAANENLQETVSCEKTPESAEVTENIDLVKLLACNANINNNAEDSSKDKTLLKSAKPVSSTSKSREKSKLLIKSSAPALFSRDRNGQAEAKYTEQTQALPISADKGKVSFLIKALRIQSFHPHLHAGVLAFKTSPPLTPPPPPPAPAFTSSEPKFSSSGTVGQEPKECKENLTSLHQELLQVSQQRDLTESAEKRVSTESAEKRVSKKKRSVLKDRYHGNPHVSVEAGALLEQKGQLKSAALPHPSQLQDVPATGKVFTSMADLLRKAMGDRRFAMKENLSASSSQEFTDVSWSVHDE